MLDSLGRMRQMSRAAIVETQVIHRCYAYWMVGVLIDHWTLCGLGPFECCGVMLQPGVPQWAELFVRSLGNDQDMFGFLLLGALQDSQLKPGERRPRVRLGVTPDIFLFLVYLCMAWPFPQIMHGIFQNWVPPEDMHMNIARSGHRWYLLMLLEARLCIALWQLLRVPPPVQCLAHLLLCIFMGQYALDPCTPGASPDAYQWGLLWVFGATSPDAGMCPILVNWVQWYLLFYILAFHYVRFALEFARPRLPSSSAWGWVAFAGSFGIGLSMAAFHYPNTVMEDGTNLQNAPLEFAANMFQPVLLALAMVHLPFDLKWWGNTTLGTYCFHFYFLSQMITWGSTNQADIAKVDSSGILNVLYVIGTAVTFTTFLGPIFHYALIGPTILYGKYRSGQRRRQLQL